MKKRTLIIYSTIASLVILFSLSFFTFNILNEYKASSTNNENRFNKMALGIKNIGDKYSINTNDFNYEVYKNIGNIKDFQYLKIQINNQDYLVYPTNATKPQKTSSMQTYKTRRFILQNNEVQIDAYIHVLSPSRINFYTKISFAIILFITAITLIIILIQSYNFPKEENIQNSKVSSEEPKENDIDLDVSYDLDQEQIIEENQNVFEQALTISEQSVIEEEFEDDYNSELPSEQIKPMEIENDSSVGLFSPTTGFGWESYLNTRLDNELNRATSSEIDLSLFILKLENVSRESIVCKQVCDYLASQFQFKDMLFEYKDDCVVGIKIACDVDEAIHFANKLLVDIDNILRGNGKCYIGISSRCIRMISAERLILEADEALKHAVEEGENSPIIAFRADVNKYRQFIQDK